MALKALQILRADILPSATAAADNAAVAFDIGQISYLELLDFRRQLLNSRLRYVEAEADMRLAEAGLKHSIGFDSFDHDQSQVDVVVISNERP